MGKGLRQLRKSVQKNSSSTHQKMLILHGYEKPVAVLIDFRKDEIAFQMQGEEKGIKAKFSQMLAAGFESMRRAVAEKKSLPQQIQEAVKEAQQKVDAPDANASSGPDAVPETPIPPVSDLPEPVRPPVQEARDEAEAG